MSSVSAALPLKVPATPARGSDSDKDKTPVATTKAPLKASIAPNDISSPHELTAFVSMLSILVSCYVGLTIPGREPLRAA